MIDIEGGLPWIVILIRKGLMEWPWRSGCENLESGRALGKAPTPLLIKGFHLEHLTKSTVERLITLTCGNHVNLGSGAWTGWPLLWMQTWISSKQ